MFVSAKGRRIMELREAGKMTLMEKLKILADAAKYDAACTSSGVSRGNSGNGMGNCTEAKEAGCRHSPAQKPNKTHASNQISDRGLPLPK